MSQVSTFSFNYAVLAARGDCDYIQIDNLDNSQNQERESGRIMNAISYFEIQASDPQKAIDFYRSVFGWKFEKLPGLPLDYWRIGTPGMQGGLLKRPAKIPPKECGTNAYVCSIEVKDFDKVADLVIKNGGQVALPKFAVPGRCWQGYFLDPETNTFGIFQADKRAK